MFFLRVAILSGLLAARPAFPAGIQVDVIPNFVGAGLGSTTEWMGSKERIWAIVPGGRVQLEQNRFIEVYGPIVDVNLIDSPNWEFGPIVSYRFGRSDVEDPVVNLLPPIEGGLEAGVFAGWHFVRTEGMPYRVRLGISETTSVSGGTLGSHVTPYASVWFPLSTRLFIGVGGGLTWSSEEFMQQRFGVSPEASAASGLPAYSASGGVRQYYLWPALIYRVSKQWYAGAGAFYQRITGDGEGSPIVAQRGDPNQLSAGIGVGYSW